MASLRALLDEELAASPPARNSAASSSSGSAGGGSDRGSDSEEDAEKETVEVKPVNAMGEQGEAVPLFLRMATAQHTAPEAENARPAKRPHAESGRRGPGEDDDDEEDDDEHRPKRNKVFALLRDPEFAKKVQSAQSASPLAADKPKPAAPAPRPS